MALPGPKPMALVASTAEAAQAAAAQGARHFEATIDVRNAGSRALAAALGFKHTATEGIDETWRREHS